MDGAMPCRISEPYNIFIFVFFCSKAKSGTVVAQLKKFPPPRAPCSPKDGEFVSFACYLTKKRWPSLPHHLSPFEEGGGVCHARRLSPASRTLNSLLQRRRDLSSALSRGKERRVAKKAPLSMHTLGPVTRRSRLVGFGLETDGTRPSRVSSRDFRLVNSPSTH